MKGVGRLVKNEVIKIFGQLSWKIITAIILAVALFGPVLSSVFGSMNSYSSGNFYREISENAADGSAEKEYYSVLADTYDMFRDNGISEDDWRFEEYYPEYSDLVISAKGYELVANGKKPEEVFEWFYDSKIQYEYDEKDNTTILYHDEENDAYVSLSAEIAAKEYKENKAKLDKLQNEVISATVASYAANQLEVLKADMKNKEDALTAAKEAYKKDSTKQFEMQAADFNLRALKSTVSVWEKVKNAGREDEAWLLNTARKIMGYLEKGEELATLGRDKFETDVNLVENYRTYDKYCKVTDKLRSDNLAAISILEYSAENSKPLPEMYPDSARGSIDEAVGGNASTVLLLCIILAATIVASEHTSGTVRLLLIRPRARWKILLSKLAAVVIYGIITFTAANILSVAIRLVLTGTDDLFVPMLVYRHGAVKEIAPVFYILAKTAISALPYVLVLIFAFFLSVAVKKVVFAVAVPMLITMFGSITSIITMYFHAKLPLLEWTLIPYFVIDNYTDHVVTRTSEYFTFDMISMGYNLKVGVVLFIIYIALITAVSFIVFRRQQIKN